MDRTRGSGLRGEARTGEKSSELEVGLGLSEAAAHWARRDCMPGFPNTEEAGGGVPSPVSPSASLFCLRLASTGTASGSRSGSRQTEVSSALRT